MEICKIKVVKRGDSFVGHHYYTDVNYLELGFHKDSNFEKIIEGEIVDAERVSEIITVKEGRVPCSWSFFKVI
jgi:hypothetical protein